MLVERRDPQSNSHPRCGPVSGIFSLQNANDLGVYTLVAGAKYVLSWRVTFRPIAALKGTVRDVHGVGEPSAKTVLALIGAPSTRRLGRSTRAKSTA